MIRSTFISSLLFIALGFSGFKSRGQAVTEDHLNIPGPIKFDNAIYNLAWNAQPLKNYYKQEYIAAGDSLERFNRMVLIDVLADTITAKDLVYLKLHALENRKKIDPATDYKLIQSPDGSEYILDFVESEGSPKIDYVEWNVYRYKAFTDSKGRKGVLLFGISTRSYGNKVYDFVGSVPAMREHLVSELIGYKLPQVTIAGN